MVLSANTMSSAPHAPHKDTIQYIGVSDLTEQEKAIVNTIVTDEFSKIKRKLNNITDITVHVKTYTKEGSKKKYSMHLKVAAPTHVFDSSNQDDWDLATALHKAFESVRNQITHKFHNDVTRP